MEVIPEQKDTVPTANTVNTQFLVSGTSEGPPWTGYYATFRGARLTVTNVFGIWCEIWHRGSGFEAHRLTRAELSLLDVPLQGIDYSRLEQTGEPITRAPSRAPMPAATMLVTDTSAGPWGPKQTPKEEPKKATSWVMPALEDMEDPEDDYPVQSLTTNQPSCQPGQPGGTGGDPMVLATMQSAGYLRLEGNPPDRFNGDRSRMRRFLTQFHQFMLMNDRATIVQNDIKKCTYFLSLMGGPEVDGWTEAKYDWLDKIKRDPRLLMGCTPWGTLMHNFLDTFTNFAEAEKAQNAMKLLRMCDGKINKYVAAFERLGHRAGVDLDDPSNMHTFAQGLPGPLVETIIKLDDPQNYVQWHEAAQRHQHGYLKIQSYKEMYGNSQPACQGNAPFSNFFWCHPQQGGQGNHQQQGGHQQQLARQWLPPRDDNAMDTSVVARKATTNKEKEEYCKTGRCFECGKQGHMARTCPTKRNRPSLFVNPSTNRTVEIEDDASMEADSQAYHWDPEILASHAMKFSEEDRDVFVQKLQELGAEMGFVKA